MSRDLTISDAKPRCVPVILRLAMVLVLLLALPVGWRVLRARWQREAVEAIVAAGGRIRFVDELPETVNRSAATETPDWARRILGRYTLRDIDQVRFSGPIPDPSVLALLDRFDQLRLLDLNGSGLGDGALVHVAKLRNLRALSLRRTAVTDAGLVHLRGLVHLEELALPQTAVTGLGLGYLGGLKRLEVVSLDQCPVTDAGLAGVGECVSLQRLHLVGTAVTDKGLHHLETLVNLRHLDLSKTAVTEIGLETLGPIEDLVIIAYGTKIGPLESEMLRRSFPSWRIAYDVADE